MDVSPISKSIEYSVCVTVHVIFSVIMYTVHYTCTYIMSHNYVYIVSNRILLEMAYLFFSGSVSVICVEYCRRMSFTVCFLGSLTNYMYSTS